MLLFGAEGGRRAAIEDAIAPLSRAGCNTHLVVHVIDALVAEMVPELREGMAEPPDRAEET